MRDSNFIQSRRTVLKSIGALGLGTSVVGAAQAASGNATSVGKARKAAKRTVERASSKDEFATWQGASVGKPTTFHARNTAKGPEYVPAAYVFSIRNEGEDVGYVTAGAQPEWSDVIEYSTAEPPQRLVSRTVSLAKDRGASPSGRLLYHGGVKYGIELDDGRGVNVRNGRPAPATGINPADVAKTSSSNSENSTQSTQIGGTRSTSSSTTSSSTTDSYSSSSYNYLWGVPAWTEEDDDDPWDEWDGCAPIAGSMIVAYHEGVGESKKEEYIDDMHRDMNTNDSGSTMPYEMDDGFDKFDTGSESYNGRSIYTWHHPDFLKQEIDAERPFLLNMSSGDQADDRDQNYGDHTVAVVGYDEGGDEFILHDTWDDTTHHFDWGSWSGASYTKVTVN